MAFLCVVEVQANGSPGKYLEFPTEAEANAHVIKMNNGIENGFKKDFPDAFVVEMIGEYHTAHCVADKNAKTCTYDDASFVAVVKDRDVRDLKFKRNKLLKDADFTQLQDVPGDVSNKEAWKTYRQALRDLDYSDPDNMVWPTPPDNL